MSGDPLFRRLGGVGELFGSTHAVSKLRDGLLDPVRRPEGDTGHRFQAGGGAERVEVNDGQRAVGQAAQVADIVGSEDRFVSIDAENDDVRLGDGP
jgi:hypothetical protein